MTKIYRFFEYAYLVFAAFFAFEAFQKWNEEPSQAYLFLFFVVLAIFMFFFKRNFRKRMDKKNNK